MISPLHRRAILLLSGAAFAAGSSMRICDAMLPEFGRVFAVGADRAALTVSGFALTYGLLQLLYGPAGDHFDKYRVIALATLSGVVGNLLAMLAPNLEWLIAGRILTGAAAAGIIPLSMAWIGDQIAYQDRQATLARFLLGQMLGLIAGQTLGGLLCDTLGWRASFACLGLVYLSVGLALWREARSQHSSQAPSGHIAFTAQLSTVLAQPWARVILATVALEGMGVFAILTFIPSHLHLRFGLSLSFAGSIPAAFGLGGITYALLSRRAVAQLGERGLVKYGGSALVAAGVTLAWAPHWGAAIPGAFLLGAGFYMFHNTLQTHATQMAPQQRGSAVALFAACFFLGQFIGVASASRFLEGDGARNIFYAAALGLSVLGVFFSRQLQTHQHASP